MWLPGGTGVNERPRSDAMRDMMTPKKIKTNEQK